MKTRRQVIAEMFKSVGLSDEQIEAFRIIGMRMEPDAFTNENRLMTDGEEEWLRNYMAELVKGGCPLIAQETERLLELKRQQAVKN